MEIDEAKIFVGGISRETSEDTLKDYFSKYGAVLHSLSAKDKITKVPRGFGFVWFSNPSFAARALQDNHVILGRTVEVKKAIPRMEKLQYVYQQQHQANQKANNGLVMNSHNNTGDKNNRTKKIFVGGLSSNLTEEQFRNYFERFGRTVDVVVMQDRLTNRRRGFGFITFDSEESVDKVLLNSFHELNGKRVEVKRAVPKDRINGHIGRGSFNEFSDNVHHAGNYSFHGPGYYPFFSFLPGYYAAQGCFYVMSVYGSVYPMAGYGTCSFRVPTIDRRSPLMFGGGPFSYSNAGVYPSNAVDMSSTDMDVCGHNQIDKPGVNGLVDAVRGGNGHVPSDATVASSEEGSDGS